MTDAEARTGAAMPRPDDKARKKHEDDGDCFDLDISSDDPSVAARRCACKPPPGPRSEGEGEQGPQPSR